MLHVQFPFDELPLSLLHFELVVPMVLLQQFKCQTYLIPKIYHYAMFASTVPFIHTNKLD